VGRVRLDRVPDGDEVEIGSRNERPMTRYFPEVVEALRANVPSDASGRGDRRDRRVPATDSTSRPCSSGSTRPTPGADARAETPARFVAFDCWRSRRRPHEAAVRGAPGRPRGRARESSSPDPRHGSHTDRAVAQDWFTRFEGAGLDVSSRSRSAVRYEPDKRVMFKVKHERTADCVVPATAAQGRRRRDRVAAAGPLRRHGDLANIGVIGAFPMATRTKLFTELQPLVTTFDGHPWDWERQMEAGDAANTAQARAAGGRPARTCASRRCVPSAWRDPLRPHGGDAPAAHRAVRRAPRREPRSCTSTKLDEAVAYDLADVLAPDSASSQRRKLE